MSPVRQIEQFERFGHGARALRPVQSAAEAGAELDILLDSQLGEGRLALEGASEA